MSDEDEKNKQKKVLIATPCYGGMLSYLYHLSVVRLNDEIARTRPDVKISTYLLGNESLVTRARNTCVAHFLADDSYTHLFFVDADIEFSPTTFLRVLDAASSPSKGVTCACYPQKGIWWDQIGRAHV